MLEPLEAKRAAAQPPRAQFLSFAWRHGADNGASAETLFASPATCQRGQALERRLRFAGRGKAHLVRAPRLAAADVQPALWQSVCSAGHNGG